MNDNKPNIFSALQIPLDCLKSNKSSPSHVKDRESTFENQLSCNFFRHENE